MGRQRRHTDWLRNQLRENIFLVVFRNSRDDGCQRRLAAQDVLFRDLTAQLIEVDILPRFRRILLRLIILDQSICDIRARPHIPFIFRWKLEALLRFGGWRGCHRESCHGGRLPRVDRGVERIIGKIYV